MCLSEPTSEEMKKVHDLARRFGGDETEEQRLVALGRRAELVFATEGVPPQLMGLAATDGQRLGIATAWDWAREQILGPLPPGQPVKPPRVGPEDPPEVKDPAPDPKTILQVWPESGWREVWHDAPCRGPMKRLDRYMDLPGEGESRGIRLWECMACGAKMYAGCDRQQRIVVFPYEGEGL